jgi:hypothetical protein
MRLPVTGILHNFVRFCYSEFSLHCVLTIYISCITYRINAFFSKLETGFWKKYIKIVFDVFEQVIPIKYKICKIPPYDFLEKKEWALYG